MKKYGSLIALVIVAILGVVVATTGKKPVQKVSAPYSVKAVENLARIELTEPGEKGELVVLEKGEEGWALTKPVEAPVHDRLNEQLGEALNGKINTDDLKLDAEKAEDYGLDEASATKVALFSAGATAPNAEFYLGKDMKVPGTGVRRTYIKTTDGKIYRAQTNLGKVLARPVNELRSSLIQKLDKATVARIDVTYTDGVNSLGLKKSGEEWTLASPKVDYELERSVTSRLLNAATRLTATGFVDDKTPDQVGLDPAHAQVVVRNAEGVMGTLLLSKPADGKAYAKTKEGKHIFEINESVAESLLPTPLSLRSLSVKTLEAEKVERIDFGGDDRVSVARDGDEWKFVKGAKGEVKSNEVNVHLGMLAKLRAKRFAPADIDTQWSAAPVVLTMKDGTKHTLQIGGEADETGDVYGKWSDTDLIMVLPKWIKERGGPSAESLIDNAS